MGAMTACRGKVTGDKIEFEEYEVIEGDDLVEVPAKYNGKLTSPTQVWVGRRVCIELSWRF